MTVKPKPCQVCAGSAVQESPGTIGSRELLKCEACAGTGLDIDWDDKPAARELIRAWTAGELDGKEAIWYRQGKKWVSSCGCWIISPHKDEWRLSGYGGRWYRKTDLMCKKLAEEKNGQRTT
jgi:hypothetical protein